MASLEHVPPLRQGWILAGGYLGLTVGPRVARCAGAGVGIHLVVACTSVQTRAENNIFIFIFIHFKERQFLFI